ncbi:MAG TPA: hypothetical protein VI386_32810 [Candidatus Sulfotelmatobacter sp.]
MSKHIRQPRHKELSSDEAITAAKGALRKRQDFLFGNTKLESEFMELELLTVSERLSAVDDALSQICAKDRMGPQPPNNISVPPYGGETLYAFGWKSSTYGSVYLKFCLVGTTGLDHLVLHSFHVEREKADEITKI